MTIADIVIDEIPLDLATINAKQFIMPYRAFDAGHDFVNLRVAVTFSAVIKELGLGCRQFKVSVMRLIWRKTLWRALRERPRARMRPPGEGENHNKAVCVTSNANGFRPWVFGRYSERDGAVRDIDGDDIERL